MLFNAEDLQEKGRRVYGAQWRQKVADKLEISKASIDGYFTKGEMPKSQFATEEEKGKDVVDWCNKQTTRTAESV